MTTSGAVGWLVGEEHQGMRAMFTMMNAARLAVAVQSTGIAEAGYQKAVAYAGERLQGREVGGDGAPARHRSSCTPTCAACC